MQFAQSIASQLTAKSIDYLAHLVEAGNVEVLCCLLDKLAEIQGIDDQAYNKVIYLSFKHQNELFSLVKTYPELSKYRMIGNSSSGFSEEALDYTQPT